MRSALPICSMAVLAAALAARALGPVDTWDQCQPRTVSYTTDILVHGGAHWVLPVEHASMPATKPPLYNWLAAPAVALCGFSSDPAHKFPSMAALCLCWLALVRLGRRIDPDSDGALGWTAAMMLPASYTFFKLGYLARPDMLLALWLALGWMAATALLARGDMGQPGPSGMGQLVGPCGTDAGTSQTRASSLRSLAHATPGTHATGRLSLQLAFWLCVALAALTKGAAALVLPVYALAGARWVAGSWRAAGSFGWWWGAPLAAAIFGAWVAAVDRIDHVHLVGTLWYRELYGQVVGLGAARDVHGPGEHLLRVAHLPFYFVVRFLPWSVPAILGIASLWYGRRAGRVGAASARAWPWLQGAAVFVVTLLGLFTLSAGKRADYIAGACPPAALLAAWWLLRSPHRPRGAAPRWLAPLAAAVAVAALAAHNAIQMGSPRPGFGDALAGFLQDAEPAIRPVPADLVFRNAGDTHVPSYLGYAGPLDARRARALVRARLGFWLVAGETQASGGAREWLGRAGPVGSGEPRLVERVRSAPTDGLDGTPGTLVLYGVGPPG